ncbi:hypothetical protein M3Y99_00567700 [Aphelenchoides fujianensis]|nr:hypothetical protein M3Y99_00567700 [Aphelenchoides fujianensis]
MLGRLQAGFSLLLVLSLFVGGATSTDCVSQYLGSKRVIVKTTDGCRSFSSTLVLAPRRGDVGTEYGADKKPVLGFSGQEPLPLDVKGTLSTSALDFTSGEKPRKTFSCTNPFGKRNASHFTLDVAVEWTGEAPNLDIKFHDATVFEYTTNEILGLVGIAIAGGVGVLLVIGGIAAGVFACRHFKWLCWSGRGKTAPVAQPAVKTAGSRRSQRAAKSAATPAPLLPTPTPTTITHSIGLTCHDDPPPRRPLGPSSKPKKTAEGCGTKTADAFGLHSFSPTLTAEKASHCNEHNQSTGDSRPEVFSLGSFGDPPHAPLAPSLLPSVG